jgi:hypothetical protein
MLPFSYLVIKSPNQLEQMQDLKHSKAGDTVFKYCPQGLIKFTVTSVSENHLEVDGRQYTFNGLEKPFEGNSPIIYGATAELEKRYKEDCIKRCRSFVAETILDADLTSSALVEKITKILTLEMPEY